VAAFRVAYWGLPETNRTTLTRLFTLMRRISSCKDANGMSSATLGIAWGPLMFKASALGAGIVQELIDKFEEVSVEEI
jgi:hypothetical protein